MPSETMDEAQNVQQTSCACNNEYNVRAAIGDFQKLVDLKDSGLVIYRYKNRIDNLSAQMDEAEVNKQNEVQESVIENTDDVFIVHNTSDAELKQADLILALDESKINCQRCTGILLQAQKLLRVIPTLHKNVVTGICQHCYLKVLSQEGCIKCKDAVRTFLALRHEHSRDKKIRVNTWLSKVNRLLDNILIDDTPNSISRAQSAIFVNDMLQTPSQTTCDQKSEANNFLKPQMFRSDTDFTGSIPNIVGYKIKSAMKSTKPDIENPVKFYATNWEGEKYTIHYMKDKYDIRDFDENPVRKKKYATRYYDTQTSQQGHEKKYSAIFGDKKSSTSTFSKTTTLSTQTLDDSKHSKLFFKSSKRPKKIQSDETMITTISRATAKKSSQKDLVYFFPKDKAKKEAQLKSYVSSATLIKNTKKDLGDVGERDKKLKDELYKKKVEEEKQMFARANKQVLSDKTTKKPYTPISTDTSTTKSKSDKESNKFTRDNTQLHKEQEEKLHRMAEMMNEAEKSKPKDKAGKVKITSPETNTNKLDVSEQVNLYEDESARWEEIKKLNKEAVLKREQEFKMQRDLNKKVKGGVGKEHKPKSKEIDMDNIKIQTSFAELMQNQMQNMTNDTKKEIGPIPSVGSGLIRALRLHNISRGDPYVISNTDLVKKNMEYGEIILGEELIKHKPIKVAKLSQTMFLPTLFQTPFNDESAIENTDTESNVFATKRNLTFSRPAMQPDVEIPKGVIKYALSDRTFIEKGWTMLPTEKIVRKMNIYRMRPAQTEYNWFENNKQKAPLLYDSGEKFALFNENGQGQWYYRNGQLALDYYDAAELNAQQRFVVYSSGGPDDCGRKYPITVLAAFDFLGNGVVFDHTGKIRLKYNQTEGVVLDQRIGPVSHWKWHALNDPPVLQQVMIDTEAAHKDPRILKMGVPAAKQHQPDNEEMLAIEFENFVKEKNKKLAQDFKPFQIRMKALKINKYFSLKVLDQATVYLIFRDGSTTFRLNIGMLLDHHEIVDTDTADLGEVTNNIERLPTRSDSLTELRRTINCAQRHEKARIERLGKLRIPDTSSADKLAAATSRPLQCPLCTISTSGKCCCRRKPSLKNLYYDTRII